MTTQYKPIDEIFAEAVDIDSPGERAKYLGEACGENTELRLKIERLVRLHLSAGDLMEQPAAQLLAAQNANSSTDNPDVLPKRQLGDFELVREIGRGGMGVVYEAHQISLNRRVALKVLPFAAVLDPRQLRRFETEAMAAAGLHHGNIVPVFYVGSDRAVHYYAMQYIEGQDVSDLIKQLRQVAQKDELVLPVTQDADFSLASDLAMGRFEPADLTRPDLPLKGDDKESTRPDSKAVNDTRTFAALSTKDATNKPEFFRTIAGLGIQAAEALEFAHENGILHRDIKPSNLMLDAGGKLWITDFGLARIEGEAGLTMTGDVMGTLRYMSPEQATGQNDAVDRRSDIYSLGVTLYEMLSLSPVCPAEDRNELLQKRLHEKPSPLRQVNKAIPADLETIVHKAIAKESDERYATAQELADDLRRFLNGEPIHARRPSVATQFSKWAQRNRTLALSFAAAFIGGIVAAGIVVVIKGPGGDELGNIKVPKDSTIIIEPSDPTPVQPSIGMPHSSDALAGLVPFPKKIPGVKSWQVITTKPPRAINHFGAGAWSPDGQHFALGRGNIVRVYSIPSFELVQVFVGHTNAVVKVAWSPGGQRLASCSLDHTVRIWNFDSGLPGPILTGHSERVDAVAWHPNGQLVASGSRDMTVRLWSVNGKQLRVMKGHTAAGHRFANGYISWLAWRADGRLASTGSDGQIRLWNDQGERVAEIDSQRKFIDSLDWNPSGKKLVTAHHGDNSVRTFSANGDAEKIFRDHKDMVTSVDWHPDGHLILSASIDCHVIVWNEEGHQKTNIDLSELAKVESAVWSPDGKWIMVTCRSGMRLYTPSGKPGPFLEGHWGVREVRWNPKGNEFAASFGGAEIYNIGVWNETGTESRILQGVGEHNYCFDWRPNGKQLILAGWDPILRLCDADGSHCRLLGPQSPDFAVKRIAWSPNGQLFAFKQRLEVRIWKANGTEVAVLPTGNCYDLAWSPDSQRLAVVTFQGDLQLYSAAGVFEEKVDIGTIATSVAWRPDGKLLATGSDDKTIQFWTPDLSPRLQLKGHEDRPVCLSWNPDGTLLASGSRDCQIRIWNKRGDQVALFKGHQAVVGRVISWHPHKRHLLSCGGDGTIRLWDVAEQRPLWTIQVLRNGQSVQFSPEGHILAGDLAVVEKEFRYILEKPTGATEIITPKEFLARTQQGANTLKP